MKLFTSLVLLAISQNLVAQAKSTNGNIAIVLNGQTINPDTGKDAKGEGITLTSDLLVRGLHMQFDVNKTDLGLYNYILTGFPDDLRLVSKPTTIYTSKTINLTADELSGATLSQYEVKDDTALLLFQTKAGKVKYQINDGATGGILQVETEFTKNVTFTHTLSQEVFYFKNPFTNKTNVGNGIDAVTKAQDPVNYHGQFFGKDSPQVATNTFQDGHISKWNVASGGRLGGVFGEDAIEMSPAASNCTSHCQAQNQFHDEFPAPAPTSETPLPTSSLAA